MTGPDDHPADSDPEEGHEVGRPGGDDDVESADDVPPDDGDTEERPGAGVGRFHFGLDPSVWRALNWRAQLSDAVLSGWRSQIDDVLRTGLGGVAEAQHRQAQEIARVALGPSVKAFTSDLSEMFSRQVDLGGWASAQSVAHDFLTRLPKIDLTEIVESIRRWIPANWPDNIDYDRLQDLLNVDGLPAVWVPSAEVLAAMLAVDDRDGRVSVLLEHASAVTADAVEVLADVTHPAFEGQVPLARAALSAWEAGFHAPAQALAVAVTENAVTRLIADGRSYREVSEDVRLNIDDVPFTELRLRAALAPLSVFYEPHWLADGEAGEGPLSRHLSVHQADAAHYTQGNALVAVLLMTSVLRSLQDYRVDLDDLAEQRPLEPVGTPALADLAGWSSWTPLPDAVRDAPPEVGVYLVRDDNDEVVYVGVASSADRTGNAGDRGLRARFAMYLAGRLSTSTVGETVLSRALGDAQWVKERLGSVESGFPQSARQWAQDAVVTADLQVAWAVTAGKQAAKDLRDAVVMADPDGLAWQR